MNLRRGKEELHKDIELLPCPFCGGPASINTSYLHDDFWASCDNEELYNCPGRIVEQDEQGGTHVDCKTEAEAAALWNRRANRVTASLAKMDCSNGSHYYVMLRRADHDAFGGMTLREYPLQYRNRAQFEVDELNFLLGNGPKPDITAPEYEDPKTNKVEASKTSANIQLTDKELKAVASMKHKLDEGYATSLHERQLLGIVLRLTGQIK